MDADRFRDLAIEHLLHGLSGKELAEFEAELRRRGAEGRRELDRLREYLAALALDAPPVDPPARLKSKVMRGIEAEGDDAAGLAPVRDRRAVSGWLIGVTAIAAGLAALLAFSSLRLSTELRRARADLAAAQERAVAADSLQAALANLQNDIMTVTSPEATAVTLTGSDESPQARAQAFIDPLTGRALIFIYELPVLPPDSVYQLWSIKDGAPIDAGTFSVDPQRRARLQVDRTEDLIGADALAVTVEPAPGVPAPTGPIVLSG